MAGYDDLRGGAHADGIGTDSAEITVFCGSFIAGTRAGHINALAKDDALLCGNPFRQADK